MLFTGDEEGDLQLKLSLTTSASLPSLTNHEVREKFLDWFSIYTRIVRAWRVIGFIAGEQGV